MRLIIQLFGKLLSSASRRFHHALENPQLVQKRVQQEIFQSLVKSEYGRFLNINTINDWQKIPIVEYHDIEQWILKEQQSKTSLLTSEPILFYEKTSGSRGAAKLIPYTKSLRHSFNQMFCVWAYDLIINGPQFSTGKIYFCISPNLTPSEEKENNIGLADDSEYLDGWLRWLLSPFLVSPRGLNKLHDAEEFKNQLSQALLIAENLEIISIWSPTFLKVILDYIQTNRQRLTTKLGNRISSQRRQILLASREISWNLLWKQLKLISCWDSVNAADSAEFLRSLFPNVLVQGKGLLATEAPMTIPLIASGGYVPVLDEVFFEFEDEQGQIHLLHQLQKGKIYEIILSQKGGLYRYRIGDRIRVSHFYKATPCLEFIGRNQEISDLVGEKLHLEFVRQVLDSLSLPEAGFKSLVPVKKTQFHYILLLDKAKQEPQNIAKKLDLALQKSPHYRHARLLGQLQPAQVIVNPQIQKIITLYKTNSGNKWGDLKYDILATTPITEKFLAELIEPTCHSCDPKGL
ncbi:MAG: GH3 auxin-responsive promoter family protein [Nostocaceae cyanobacterium]|nr:GH3 auxin-responsive promoter family protein [Nostocaceae cyanobacterium]